MYPEPPVKLLSQKAGLEDRIKILGEPLLEVKRGLTVRKGNQELLKKLDDEVKTFTKTQRYADIYAQWFRKPEPYWTTKRVAVFGCGLLAFAIITLTVWRYLSMLRLKLKAEIPYYQCLTPNLFTSCKKVRDDRGYWNQIEVYIRDHSEAEFSHGICPDCMKKLYPNL